ncbi:MAG: Terminase-like family protein [Chloroflexi bacterium ADurb.Bin180]|nr:MAG: Terminase-like family protein [Chloroflexi bacterium ADurb.Bin180]
MMTGLEIDLPPLHAGQREVRDHPARFKVVAAGRRWRKTSLGVLICTNLALRGKRAWWVGPTFPVASIGWRMLRHIAIQIPGVVIHESDRRIDYPGPGGWAQVKSAHDPDSLRGEGLDYAVMDECAFAAERAWTEGIRPALSDRLGGALFLSTPKGRNWFWQMWLRGQSNDDPEWKSWRFTTADNPNISGAEVEAAKRMLPESVFRQEFEAEFLEDAGSVFRKVTEAMTAQPAASAEGTRFGVDWGKHADFTCITVLDRSGQMIAWDRFNQIDYTVQTQRLKAMADVYKPSVIVAESNAMGEPIIEQLRRDNLPVVSFATTAASKAQMVEGLALAFEKGEIKILPEPVLVNELQAFEMTRLPGGGIRYAAPEGLHDDCVISLALAWWGTSRALTGSLMA